MSGGWGEVVEEQFYIKRGGVMEDRSGVVLRMGFFRILGFIYK